MNTAQDVQPATVDFPPVPKKRGPKPRPLSERLARAIEVHGQPITAEEVDNQVFAFPHNAAQCHACWLWTGANVRRKDGHFAPKPVVWHEGATCSTVRVIIEAINGGPMGSLWYAKRTCRSTLCVNPYHHRPETYNRNRGTTGPGPMLSAKLIAWAQASPGQPAQASPVSAPAMSSQEMVDECVDLIRDFIGRDENEKRADAFDEWLRANEEEYGLNTIRSARDVLLKEGSPEHRLQSAKLWDQK